MRPSRSLALIAIGLLFLAMIPVINGADKKISDYPNTSSLNNSDKFVVAVGATNKNISWSQVRTILDTLYKSVNAASGVPNTVVSTALSSAGQVPVYSDITSTNIQPSGVVISNGSAAISLPSPGDTNKTLTISPAGTMTGNVNLIGFTAPPTTGKILGETVSSTTNVTITAGTVDVANVPDLTGANAFTANNSFPNITFGASAITASSAVTNFIPDLSANSFRTLTAAADINLASTANKAAGRSVVIRMIAGGSDRALTFNSNWTWFTSKPTTLTNATTAILNLTAFGTAESDVVAAIVFNVP